MVAGRVGAVDALAVQAADAGQNRMPIMPKARPPRRVDGESGTRPERLADLLAAGLDARDRQHFSVQPGTPLVPVGETRRGLRTLTAVRVARMTPTERRRRMEALQREERDLKREQRKLLAADRGAEEPADLTTLRYILVGAVLMKLAELHPGLMRWLKALLNARLTARRDRVLFRMGESGRLVLEEESPDPRAAGRAAKEANSGPQDREGQPASGEGATAGDADAPIPGWRPCRVSVPASSTAGSGTRPATEWGARLTGVRRVAELPDELCGRTITVTDSGESSWETTVTEVVSRDDKAAVVRNAGRPASSRAHPQEKEEPSS